MEIMDKRLLKQIIFGFIFLAIFSGIGTGLYFWLKPAPTCFDHKKNQGEEEVDCGGPCPPCEIRYLQPITVKKIINIKAGDKYDIGALVFNPNAKWGAQSFNYKFNILGPLDTKQEITGTEFILPAEEKWILLPNQNINFTVLKTDFEIETSTISWAVPESDILPSGKLLETTVTNIIWPKLASGSLKPVYNFTQTLKKGSIGAQVRDLQVVLSLDPTVYPEAQITGKFGNLTYAAVKRFQKKYNLSVTGIVDKATRAKLNELYGHPVQPAVGSPEATLEFSGQVFNHSVVGFKKADVILLLCDNQNNIIASGKTQISVLPAGANRSFKITFYRSLDSKNTKWCGLFAYTNVFDKNNLIVAY